MTGSYSLGLRPPAPAARPDERRGTVIVSSLASDSHTWNLVYLQLLIEELGYDVVNLGACVPEALLLSETLARRPDLVVLSSVNGHGHRDGPRAVGLLRDRPELRDVPVVIGGKLGVRGGESRARLDELLAAGFDAVFDDGDEGVAAFRAFAAALPGRTRHELG